MRVAIVAYYYEPEKSVGVLRPAYWAKHLAEVDPNITCDVVTAQDNVPNTALPGGGTVVTVGSRKFLFDKMKFDPGAGWIVSLIEFFSRKKEKYDVVLFTGGPFLHFFSARILKKKIGSKVIFDFRDPFANNPNHKLPFLKRYIKDLLEKRMLQIPDVVITVNQFCSDLMKKNSKTKIEIIENGYDETAFINLDKKGGGERHRIVYAGKFYENTSPDNLFEVLKQMRDRIVFEYMGPNSEYVLKNGSENFIVSGSLAYKEAISRISKSDTCIILTGGESFQSTTKIFDYIALEKNIIIITNGVLKTGNLYEITKKYPNVFWSLNERTEIQKTIERVLCYEPVAFPEKELFSRRAGLIKLNRILKECTEREIT